MVKRSFDQQALLDTVERLVGREPGRARAARPRLRRLDDLRAGLSRACSSTAARSRSSASARTAEAAIADLRATRARPRDDGHRAARDVRARGGRADHERADPTPILVLSAHVGHARPTPPPRSPPARSTRSARRTSTSATRQAPARPPFAAACRCSSGARVIRHPRARLNGAADDTTPAGAPASVIGDLRVDRRPAGARRDSRRRSRRRSRSRSWSSSTSPPGFTEGLARWLDATHAAARAAGRARARPARRRDWLAPDGADLAPAAGRHARARSNDRPGAAPPVGATRCSRASPRMPARARSRSC